ncbi:hypothetical protein [Mycoplasma elephantis]|uniref:hypothetical protein n=1 Tax=Mycoplasma elephantis TaxID=114882 RepID=UPI000487F147|nr:hypothetical protein [Mycoplasma elephantis]
MKIKKITMLFSLSFLPNLTTISCINNNDYNIDKINEFRGKRVINNLKIDIIGENCNLYTSYNKINFNKDNNNQILLSDIVQNDLFKNNYLLELVDKNNSLFLKLLSRTTPANATYFECIKCNMDYKILNVEKKYNTNNKLINIKFMFDLKTYVYANNNEKYYLSTTNDVNYVLNHSNEFQKIKIYYDESMKPKNINQLTSYLNPGFDINSISNETKKQLSIIHFLSTYARQNLYFVIDKNIFKEDNIDLKMNKPKISIQIV